MNLSVELYEENGTFCAYICDVDNGGSGYSIKRSTEEERAEDIKQYILNYC